MNRDQKAQVIEEVAGQTRESQAVFAVDYRGISVPQAAECARSCARPTRRSASSRTRSPSARPTRSAPRLKELLAGPTAMTFVRGDAAAAAKALRDFRRGTGGTLLEFKGGWMNGNLTPEDVDAIAQLPSREVLDRPPRRHDRLAADRSRDRTEQPARRPCAPAAGDRRPGPPSAVARRRQQPLPSPTPTTPPPLRLRRRNNRHGYQHPGMDRRAQVHLGPRALRAHQGARGGLRRLRGRRRGRPRARRRRDGDAAEPEEEQTAFDVILTGPGDKKIQVIKVVRAATGLGLRRPRRSSTRPPSPSRRASTGEAEKLKAELEEAGGPSRSVARSSTRFDIAGALRGARRR